MNAAALTILADAAEMRAAELTHAPDGGIRSARDLAQSQLIAAQNARREAEAASGYGTEATLAWSIYVDNDRETFDTIRAMVAEHAGSETARADLADALKDWTENTAGLEGAERHNGMTVGTLGGAWSLSPLMLALIRSAIVAIDWHRLAVVLLDEHEEGR